MNNHKTELINARHADLHHEIAILSAVSTLKEKEATRLRTSLEKKLLKRFGIKSGESDPLTVIKNTFINLEREMQVFIRSFQTYESLLGAGAKESELSGLKKFQARLEKDLKKIYNINDEEYNIIESEGERNEQ